jgi:putative nucleotidyltransferase with HDIG domain
MSISSESRWEARPRSAFALKAVIVVFPLVVGVATTVAMSWLVPRPTGRLGTLWWLGALTVSALAVGLVIRLLERFAPLVALLRFSLAFPDHTPSRARMALRAGSIRGLEARVADLRARGAHADVATAAENVVVIAAGLTVHDRKTRGHCERVRALSELIAEQLKLDPADQERLRWASLIHDCGKLMVDAKILNKTGSLDDEEWAVIRRHPEEGARIALPLRDWLGDWSLAVAEHHERWNGRGYPRGLSGEDISLAARIVAVADSFDAMTSARSYQKAMTPAAARTELTRKAGIDFDPQVVRAFLLVSRGRVNRVLGPLSWLTMIPLAGTSMASAMGASARRAQNAAAVVGAGGAVAAATALGIAGPVAGSAHLARPAPVVAASAPTPEVRFVPAVAAPATPPVGAPAPAGSGAASTAGPTRTIAATATATAAPADTQFAPTPGSPGAPPASSPTHPTLQPRDTTPAPPPTVHVAVQLGDTRVEASVPAPARVCTAVTVGSTRSSC